MFSDFQCPYCGDAHAIFEDAASRIGDGASFVFKHMPLSFHKNALPAALAAEAAGRQGQFWEYVKLLYANHTALDDANLVLFAQQIGLDMGAFNTDRASDECLKRVQADIELAQQVGVRGTPTLFINGRRYLGPRDAADIEEIVRQEILE